MKIITLTVNPAFDMHCYVENFVPYHENLAIITDYDAGGKGVNISRALTQNEIDNLCFVVLGEENGDSFEKRLIADGIKYRSISLPGRIRENITIHTEGAAETRISFSGFRADGGLMNRIFESLKKDIDKETVVTFTGRVPDGIEMSEVKAFLLQLQAQGSKIVIDSRAFSLNDLIEMKPWLIKPNQEEISEYLNRSVEAFDEVMEAANELHRKGIANVMISLGSKGALLVSQEGILVATPPSIQARSTIGAGDSSIAGFLAAAEKGGTAEQMLLGAVAFGTAACLTEGTRPPLAEDVKAISGKITLCRF